MARGTAGAGPYIAIGIKLNFTGVTHPVGQTVGGQIFCFGIKPEQGIVAGATDPHMPIGGYVERVGDLVFLVG